MQRVSIIFQERVRKLNSSDNLLYEGERCYARYRKVFMEFILNIFLVKLKKN